MVLQRKRSQGRTGHMIKQGIKQIVKIKRLAVHKHEKDRKKRNLKSAIFHVHRAINKFISISYFIHFVIEKSLPST